MTQENTPAQSETKMEKLDGKSMDVVEHNIEQLKELFPEVFSEGKVNFDKLQELLGNYVVEDEDHYNFTWHGKLQAGRLAQTPSTGTLRPAKDESVDWGTTKNLFIEGDNLEVLKLLQKSYHRQVKMIYIDPPYNTGNDFVYEDDFKDGVKNYLETTGQLDSEGKKKGTNSSSAGRYHTNWLNMMYPRLKLARNLLTDDGVIFISIDENEQDNLKKLCNEIIGEENFIGQLTVLNNPKGRALDKHIANCHEYLFVYSKCSLEAGSLSVLKELDEIKRDYPLEDFQGRYRELELRNTHREFGKHNRSNLYYPFYVGKDGKISLTHEETSQEEVYPIWADGREGCWTWGKAKASSEIEDLLAKKIKGAFKIYRKSYASRGDDRPKRNLKSILTEKQFHTEKGQSVFNNLFKTKDKIFQSPKSVDLIKQALSMATHSQGGIIMDFFAGSGTTAHAVMQLNAEDGGKRRCISVQLPEETDEKSEACKAGYKNIAEISKERIRRAAKKIKGENTEYDGDLGFKVFKLDSSNIKRWEAEFDTLEEDLLGAVDYIKNERTNEDVLYELLLKYGLDLTVSIETRQIPDNGADKTIYSIGLGALVVCLDKDVSMDVVDAIGEMKEELKPEIMRVVFKDEGFKDDVAKTNALQTLKLYGIEDIKCL